MRAKAAGKLTKSVPNAFGGASAAAQNTVCETVFPTILNVLAKQLKKGRAWRNDGSYIRSQFEYLNHVCSYNFLHCRTENGNFLQLFDILFRLGQLVVRRIFVGWKMSPSSRINLSFS